MKNKQPNGQTFGPKMARALLKRCNELEDCVVSQQKIISEQQSQITNDTMAHVIMEKRYKEMLNWVEVNRPEILKLMKVHAKHGVLASQGKLPAVNVKLTKRKKKAGAPQGEHVVVVEAAEEMPNGDVKVTLADPQTGGVLKGIITPDVAPFTTSPEEVWNKVTRKFEPVVTNGKG